MTPRSLWFDGDVDVDQIDRELGWPVFLKGERQTSRHNPALSIAQDVSQLRDILAKWKVDPILGWRRVVAREFVPLKQVAPGSMGRLPVSYEFRCFCWRGQAVGVGAYWVSEVYQLTPDEEQDVRDLAESAAALLDVPFVVIDIAQTEDGRWIVIECNDGQDSGYGGVDRRSMWAKVIEIEKA